MRSTRMLALLAGALIPLGALPGPMPALAKGNHAALGDPTNLAASGATVLRALGSVRTCGTTVVSPGEADAIRVTLSRWVADNAARANGGTIRVAFHVITAHGEGSVSDRQITDQIGELNRDYQGTGYRFELASVDRTEDAGWFRMIPGSKKERQAKKALAIDPAHRLNLYTCAPGQRLLGWASFPWSAPESDPSHGVVVHYATLPGGVAPFDLGRTATHEIGHYLGLYHTFQWGCVGPGDEVDDTPCEASPALGCPEGRNTCSAPGVDPIHDYMDYTDDACTQEFTPGQGERVHALVSVYRPSLFVEPVAQGTSQPEISPGLGAEPEDGHVLAYRGASPNPFRFETALRFTLPARADVSLSIYSVTGQLVRTLVDAPLPAGDHSALFRADGLASGVYFSVLRVGRVQMTRTLVLVR